MRHIRTELFNPLDDERKLLYVALTRAKRTLYLSESSISSEGKVLLPSRLLSISGENIVEIYDTKNESQSFDPTSILQNVNIIPEIAPILVATLKERGLSATSLNNYLRDPWTYLYRNVLRIPEVQSESALFGTALHDSLRSIFVHRRQKGTLPNETQLSSYLKAELEKLPLTVSEYTRFHEAGYSALLSYCAHISSTLPYATKEEYTLRGSLKTNIEDFPEILLTGKLDRLDFDKNEILVRVVDYKSGKPRTRGYIEGQTKDSSGDYKRQLTFYALLLQLSDNDLLQSKEGLLSFIEPDNKGKIHEEAYSISEEEIGSLKTEIIRIVQEITTGSFLLRECDETKSDYCALASNFRKRLNGIH